MKFLGHSILLALVFLIPPQLHAAVNSGSTYYGTYIVNQTMGADVAGSALTIDHSFGFSIQAIWTGVTAAGNLTVEASNDKVQWDTIGGSNLVVAGAGQNTWNVGPVYFHYFRLHFVRTGGTGNLTANAFTKDGWL